MFACKPYQISGVLEELGDGLNGKALVSVAAGWDYVRYSEVLDPSVRFQFVMPNTPALVGEGMTALCDDSTFSREDFDYVKGIFDSIGKTRILPERLFDGVTAISGSSPAYVYMMIEAMADAGVREGLPLSTSHRHQSHLFPIYPLHEMTLEKDKETIDHCLTVLGINGRGEWVGWSFPWVALLGAYSGRPAMARNTMLDYADRYVTESTVHYQGPQNGCDISLYGYPGGNFSQTIEAGLGSIAALQEMAIQSNGGIIRLFENTPPAWADIELADMRTEGAFLVSAARKEYITQFVEVQAEHGGKLALRTDFGTETVHVEINGQRKDFVLQDGTLEIGTTQGDTLFIWAGANRPEAKIMPLAGIPTDYNFYGVKKISRF